MAITLPTYQGYVERTKEAGAVRIDTSAFKGPAEAMGEFGRQITATASRWGTAIRQQQERNESVAAAKQFLEIKTAEQARLREAKLAAPDGAPEFTKTLLAQFDADQKTRLAAAPESARPWLDLQLSGLRASLQDDSEGFETTARLGKQRRDLTDLYDLAANGVRSDDAQYAQNLGVFVGAVAASSLAEPMKIEVQRQGQEKLATAALQGLTERDPSAAIAALGRGDYDAALSPGAKNSLLNGAQAELKRRQQEAEQRRRQAEADHRALVADLRVEAASAETALRLGVDYAGLDTLIAKADRIEPKIAAGLRDAHADLGWQQGLTRISPEAQRAEVGRVRAAAEAEENPAVAATLAARAERGERLIAHTEKALRADPLGYAETAGVSQPGNLLADLADAGNDEVAIKAALDTRARAVAGVGERYGVKVPFLRPQEIDSLGATFDAGDAAQRTAALAVLARIPSAEVGAVLTKWKDDKPDVVAAVGLARTDPRAAEAVVRGRAVRAEQPKAVPAANDAIFAGALEDSLTPFNARPDVRRQADEAIRSAYADLSARAGDYSGIINSKRLREASQMVTGNTVEWAGQTILPPSRTMTQDQFEARMDALPDDVGAFTASGTPVSGSALRRQGVLEGIGQGQYRVRFASGYALDASGRPFVLDLREGR